MKQILVLVCVVSSSSPAHRRHAFWGVCVIFVGGTAQNWCPADVGFQSEVPFPDSIAFASADSNDTSSTEPDSTIISGKPRSSSKTSNPTPRTPPNASGTTSSSTRSSRSSTFTTCEMPTIQGGTRGRTRAEGGPSRRTRRDSQCGRAVPDVRRDQESRAQSPRITVETVQVPALLPLLSRSGVGAVPCAVADVLL
jgi:hypothetical protein